MIQAAAEWIKGRRQWAEKSVSLVVEIPIANRYCIIDRPTAIIESNNSSEKTMAKQFNKIGLIGRQRGEGIDETLKSVADYLKKQHCQVVVETSSANLLPSDALPSIPGAELHKHCDLIIVVGGDGSLLHAARLAAPQHLPVLGINRGRLGFLTDIAPDELDKIGNVLGGHYLEESRFLLSTEMHSQQLISHGEALNDVVLAPGATAQMIEFVLCINDQIVSYHRADGLIVATPTGSTAYALSAGGPVLHPTLDAIVLVPLCSHTLSSRPLVVGGDCQIDIQISPTNTVSPNMSADGQEKIPVPPGSKIVVKKNPHKLRLIHPEDYQYFSTLRTKLYWK